MVKFISQILSAKALLFQERLMVGEVSRVLIDPKDGALVGIEIKGENEEEVRYIPPTEIKGFGNGLVLIKDLNSLSTADEVIKIKEVLDQKIEIIKSKVYFEDGRYLGRVDDATINLKISTLEKIYVNPRLSTKFFSECLIISAKSIVKIEPKKITIKDDRVKSKKSILSPVVAPITE